jgi:hypothetical protein
MTKKKSFRQTLLVSVLTLVFLLAYMHAFAQDAEPVLATPDQQRQMMAWIPPSCCVTNNCCFEVNSSELKSLDDDKWEVVATGQVLKRTDWSQSGRYVRCACDMVDGHWKVHRNARTRCVFPVLQSAKLH